MSVKTYSSAHEIRVLPAVVVIDTSEKAEPMMAGLDQSLLIRLCTAGYPEQYYPNPLVSVITSGDEPEIINSWHIPFRPKRLNLTCRGQNHMHRSLYMAMEEIRCLCRHLEYYEIAYEKPRIYMLCASEADDEENGVMKALRLRTERGICDFILAVYGTDHEKDCRFRMQIPACVMSFYTPAEGIEWIMNDLKRADNSKKEGCSDRL